MEVQTDKQKRSYSPNPVPVGEKSSSANPRIGMGEEEEVKKQTPPSAASHSSSPSHEFSFTISLCSSNTHHNQKNIPISIDLSPADDLFLHGQLLPLHLLSTNSPRPSTTTTITSSLEIENLPNKENIPTSNIRKPKSFSFSSLISSRWRSKTTGGGGGEREIGLLGGNRLSKILHKYLRAVRPLFGRIGEKKGRQAAYPCSFSGNLQSSSRRRRNGSGGEWSSAPASKRPSPTNSGLLIMPNNSSNFPSSYSSNDSTMEELHTAIQAAIAHCKNSIDVKEESCKC